MISRDEYLDMPIRERFIPLNPEEEARAEKLHQESLVVDLHTHVMDEDFTGYLDRILGSGVDLFIEAVAAIDEDFARSMNLLGGFLRELEEHPEFVPAYCSRDILEAKEAGKRAVMFQLEPQSFGRDLGRIEIAFGHGVRMALLTFNTRNFLGDGCGEREDQGLSNLGLEAVKRMNELNMLIDLSHCGIQTTLDAVEASEAPVMCNHTGARSLYPTCKRLLTDEEAKAIAAKGGLVGVSAIPNQLSPEPEQGIEDMLDHIDYFVQLIGVDHVGLGLDNVFEDHVAYHRQAADTTFKLAYIGQELNAPYMYGIESPEEWPNITRGLVARGYPDDGIRQIIGGNALRVIREVIG